MKRIALTFALAFAVSAPALAAQSRSGDSLDPSTGAIGFSLSLPTFFTGSAFDRQRGPTTFKSLSAVNTTSETTLWTPTTGKKFRLMGFYLIAGTATTLTLRDHTAGSTILLVPVGTAPSVSPPMGNGLLSGAVNRVLTGQGVAALSGFVFGTEE